MSSPITRYLRFGCVAVHESGGLYACYRVYDSAENAAANDGATGLQFENAHLWPAIESEVTRAIRDQQGRYQLVGGDWIAPDQIELGVDYEFATEASEIDVADRLKSDIVEWVTQAEARWPAASRRPVRLADEAGASAHLVDDAADTRGLLQEDVIALRTAHAVAIEVIVRD